MAEGLRDPEPESDGDPDDVTEVELQSLAEPLAETEGVTLPLPETLADGEMADVSEVEPVDDPLTESESVAEVEPVDDPLTDREPVADAESVNEVVGEAETEVKEDTDADTETL